MGWKPRVAGDQTAPLHKLNAEDFPTLSNLDDFERVMWLDDEQFRFGLRLLIGGIRRQYALT